MARFLFALLLGMAALAQATVLPVTGPLSIMPNLVLVLLLVWCALRGIGEGLIWIFGAGVLLDVLAKDVLGTNGLALLVIVPAAALARRRLFHNGVIVPLVVTLLATLAFALALTVLRAVNGGAPMPLAAVFRLNVLQALLNAVLVPPLYLLAGRIARSLPEGA